MKTFATLILVGILFVVGIAWAISVPYTTATDVSFTVTGRDRITHSDGNNHVSSKWIVLTTTETFENSDTLFYWKFNSSDIEGRLEIGKTYNARVYGYRIPFLSSYRNIISIEK